MGKPFTKQYDLVPDKIEFIDNKQVIPKQIGKPVSKYDKACRNMYHRCLARAKNPNRTSNENRSFVVDKEIIINGIKVIPKCYNKPRSKMSIYELECTRMYERNRCKTEKSKAAKQRYVTNNKDRLRRNSREHYKTEEYRQYCRDRYKKVLSDRLRRTLSGSIRNVTKKDTKTDKYLGISTNILRIYLELQFKDDMNWENYGKLWEIDHMIPCSILNTKTGIELEESIKQIFHFTNLRPLYKIDNILKHNKLSLELIDQVQHRYDNWLKFSDMAKVI